MSRRRPKWKEAQRYFRRHGFEIHSDGGDKVVVAPPDPARRLKRQTVRIGHRFARPGVELPWGHIRQIERPFAVTVEDILGE